MSQRFQNRYIRISSEDKSSGSSNSRFRVNLPSTGQQIDRISGYAAKYASCPNVFPNVPTYANTLQLIKTTGLITYDIVIPVGQYTVTTLIAAIDLAVNAVIADVVTTTFDSFSEKLTLTFVGDTYEAIQANSTIADRIGLTADVGPALVLLMPSMVNITGESEVWVHSRIMNAGGLTEASGNFSVVMVIPFGDVPYGAVGQIVEPDAALSSIAFEPFSSRKSFRTVDIVLRNRTGQVLVLPPNFYFSMMVKASYNQGSR